ncbi:selenocysteine lyase [Candidatus Pacearchaeota archaeon CG10_big_fil_rev_8_21_14_0_10_34_76]|nr:MAG: selenocysteine lyase [Candidatus Pacearchaeota archaeon CG10_big_fil_rev_8_21_14_0_10_34_76]
MIFGFNAEKIKKDFPILENNPKTIYLDSACISLKPKCVIDKMNEYYYYYTACAGRSSHKFGRRLDEEISSARREIARFISAKEKEIVFTRNATEAINLVISGLSWKKGDEVIITDKEHSSNLIPWIKLAEENGIKVVVCESNLDNTFNMKNFKNCFNEKTKFVSIVHISNLDGVENPINEIAKFSHEKGVKVMIDACQSVPHIEIDVGKIDCDFLAFSGHKMCGPSGTGALYGKFSELEKLKMFIVGGETIKDSSFEDFVPEDIPHRFEAGLQNYSGIIGFGEACRYLRKIGMKNIGKHEHNLNKIITDGLKDNKKVEIIGPADSVLRNGIFNFNIKGMTPHEVAKILDSGYGIMVRGGAHCVHGWFNKHNINGSVRASFYFYNTEEDAMKFIRAVDEISKIAK